MCSSLMEMKMAIDKDTKLKLVEMLYELQTNWLEVVLIPQKDPANADACIRRSISQNVDWYRQLCANHESSGKQSKRRKKFQTKIKRKDIISTLTRLIGKGECDRKYADELVEIAKHRLQNGE